MLAKKTTTKSKSVAEISRKVPPKPVTKSKPFKAAPVQAGQSSDIQRMIARDVSSKTRSMESSIRRVRESQDSMNAKVSSLSTDNFKLNAEYRDLNAKMAKLAEDIEKLSSALEDQSDMIRNLNRRRYAAPRKTVQMQRRHYLKYNVQAIIPGRAWLIAENGSTLTVRNGSGIPGYGIVTMVDAATGRVMTNSGKIITFAQSDS